MNHALSIVFVRSNRVCCCLSTISKETGVYTRLSLGGIGSVWYVIYFHQQHDCFRLLVAVAVFSVAAVLLALIFMAFHIVVCRPCERVYLSVLKKVATCLCWSFSFPRAAVVVVVWAPVHDVVEITSHLCTLKLVAPAGQRTLVWSRPTLLRIGPSPSCARAIFAESAAYNGGVSFRHK